MIASRDVHIYIPGLEFIFPPAADGRPGTGRGGREGGTLEGQQEPRLPSVTQRQRDRVWCECFGGGVGKSQSRRKDWPAEARGGGPYLTHYIPSLLSKKKKKVTKRRKRRRSRWGRKRQTCFCPDTHAAKHVLHLMLRNPAQKQLAAKGRLGDLLL